VDDGSTDGTWDALVKFARCKHNCRVVRHESNQGIAAAILTGARSTDAPVIGAIDADCTYDPIELPALLERLTEHVAAVTASPYHPDGGVEGIAAWRIWISKAASLCYRGLSRNKLHTYTSCFRLYRREALEGVHVRYRRFAGIAELLWHIDRRGGAIVEYPAVLTRRKVGCSKLRVAPAVWEHARLLSRCAWQRLWGRRAIAFPTATIRQLKSADQAQDATRHEAAFVPFTEGETR
jgi:glycosyltransferase involved in cell wall biosynthesis